MGFAYYWSILSLLCSLSILCSAASNITVGQSISDGETIVSPAKKFVLGFFSPGNSTSRYVGIMFYGVSPQTVVWVANRESPISGKAGALTLTNNGVLVISDGFGNWVWTSNVSSPSNRSIAMLMDSGNLVISREDHVDDVDNALWQSFNHPTDTYLPDMRVHTNIEAGETRVLATWKNENDPSLGRYTMGVDPRGSPQVVLWDGDRRRWRSGHWNGVLFIGIPTMPAIYLYGFKIYNEGGGRYYLTYISSNTSDLVRFWLSLDGKEEQLMWDEGRKQWDVVQSQPANECEVYNRCGSFGKCSWGLSPICSCLEGFEPKNRDQWEGGDWTGGCVRRTQLDCGKNGSGTGLGDGFLKLEGVKVPDFADLMDADDSKDCEEKCLRNCSCHAYAYVKGINCMIWGGDLVDIQHFREGDTNLLIRVAGSELGKKTKVSKMVIIITIVVGIFFISVSILLLWRRRTKAKAFQNLGKNNQTPITDPRSREFSTDYSGADDLGIDRPHTGADLCMYSFSEVAAFTDNFSEANKLGKGGFGSVYKGTLSGGELIAVKRLSKKSGQGLEEFTNEIIMIAKLQHRNLVRLLGCCIDGEERMLLYEYMENKSLDFFLFDPVKQAQLDWTTRFSIIEGIARGLLYLHRDSRLRIIHRDLKASNILLDEDMVPKISDFGMAKIFGRNENQASTSRVVGTYGYMAPEYAMEGLFSVKSDVYSFGVLLLEIVTGRRNSSFRTQEYSNIIGYAWDLWDSGRAMEMIDPSITGSCSKNEVLRCIHVAMLCIQDSAVHRPIMSSVVLMLESESAALPLPRPPNLTSTRVSSEIDECPESSGFPSANDLTLSVIVGR